MIEKKCPLMAGKKSIFLEEKVEETRT